LTACQKVACLLLSLDRELSGKILRTMRDEDVHAVTLAMKDLEEIALDDATVNEILRETVERLRKGGLALGDVGPAMKEVLAHAFGPQRSQEVVEQVERETLSKWPFARFEAMPAQDLLRLLEGEHPQIVAVFLAHLDPAKAGEVLSLFPEEARPDLVGRIATLDRTPPDVLQRVIKVLQTKVKSLGVAGNLGQKDPNAWVKAAAQILNNMEGAVEKEILSVVAEKDRDVADRIREEMFTFDDLADLDKRAMQKLLGGVDTRVLAYALKACDTRTEENIFNNLSKRAREMVLEERDSLGPVPLSEVLDAQKEILGVVRQMMETGEIKVSRGGATQLV